MPPEATRPQGPAGEFWAGGGGFHALRVQHTPQGPSKPRTPREAELIRDNPQLDLGRGAWRLAAESELPGRLQQRQ